MRTLIFIIYVLAPFVSFSQNSLNDSVFFYSDKYDYGNALHFAKKDSIFTKNKYGDNSKEFAICLFNLGRIRTELNQGSEAEYAFKKCLFVLEKIQLSNDDFYARAQESLADLYNLLEKFDEAETLCKKIIKLRHKINGDSSREFGDAVILLGDIYASTERYEEAIITYTQGLQILKKIIDINDRHFQSVLNNLGLLFLNTGDYANAKTCFTNIIFYAEKEKEPNPELSTFYTNMADVYSKLDQYKDAEKYYRLALKFDENYNNGRNNSAITLGNFAHLQSQNGQYHAADQTFDKAISIQVSSGDTVNGFYAMMLNNYGQNCYLQGKYEKADKLFQSAINKLKKNENEKLKYAMVLVNMGMLYTAKEQYAEVEPLLLKALQLVEEKIGISNKDYNTLVNNIACYYVDMGNYDLADSLLQGCIERCRLNGDSGLNYSLALSNLATEKIYSGKYNYNDVSLMYSKALEICYKIVGEDHPYYGTLLNRIGILFNLNYKFRDAKNIIKKSAAICKKNFGEDHSSYITAVHDLGTVYWAMADFTRADSCYSVALRLDEKNGRTNQEANIQTISDLGTLKMSSKDYTAARDLFLRVIFLNRRILSDKLDFLSESELLNYIKYRENVFQAPYSMLCHKTPDTLVKALYDNQLFIKGISVQNNNSLNKYIEQTKDNDLISLWKNYVENKKLLNQQLSLPIANRIMNADSLKAICGQQEKMLLRQSSAFRNVKEQLNINWRDVQKNLQPDEAAIEFVRFKYKNREYNDSVLYMAMVVLPGIKAPLVINLCEEKDLKKILAIIERDHRNNDAYKKLYILLWSPLTDALKKTGKVYYTADGLLLRVAFAGLKLNDDSLLCERYKLEQLSSTREIAIKKIPVSPPGSIALFGGINYDEGNAANTADGKKNSFFYQQERGATLKAFNYLPGTLAEIDHIQKIMKEKNKRVNYYAGKNAGEASFREESSRQDDVLHFATHGFSFPDILNDKNELFSNDPVNTFKNSSNPLLRSGLIMAGGNKGWLSKANKNEDDGILTALEISSQDFSATKLVVLSACETGLGEIKGTEGVFGLQRAFKMAGVSYIMASLWKVDDVATQQFMTNFYQYWMKGSSVQEAYWKTQQTMRNGGYSVEDWAAFTLIH